MKRVKDHRYLYRRDEVYYFRRAVPAFARAAFGRGEVQASLQTTKLAEARHLLLVELEKFEAKLSDVSGRASPAQVIKLARNQVPTKPDVEEAVRKWLTDRVARFSPGNIQTVKEGEARLQELDVHAADVTRGIRFGGMEPTLTTAWIVEELIERNGWTIDPGSDLHRHLIQTVGRGQLEADNRYGQDLQGTPRTTTDETFSIEKYRDDADRERHRGKAASLRSLFDGYVGEVHLAPATLKAWTRQFEAFVAFLGHDDARRVSLAEVVAWKEHLLSKIAPKGRTLSPKTVRDTYLAVLKTVFRWAVENGRIASNPADRVTVRARNKNAEGKRGLNDAEAMLILQATMQSPPEKLSAERARARRWVPWICAYTGARVNEITQLRSGDVKIIGETWTIRITPEAGSVKSGKARTVALHPHLVEQGFPEIVQELNGPIFYNPARRRGGSDAHPQSTKVGQHLAEWVRELGVTDENVMPNHGWRHRFKTISRLVDMNTEIRDAIQGHAPRTVGEGYGDTLPEVTLRELMKLPRYKVATSGKG